MSLLEKPGMVLWVGAVGASALCRGLLPPHGDQLCAGCSWGMLSSRRADLSTCPSKDLVRGRCLMSVCYRTGLTRLRHSDCYQACRVCLGKQLNVAGCRELQGPFWRLTRLGSKPAAYLSLSSTSGRGPGCCPILLGFSAQETLPGTCRKRARSLKVPCVGLLGPWLPQHTAAHPCVLNEASILLLFRFIFICFFFLFSS